MSKKKVYISLPITGCDIDEVEAKSIFVSSVLENKGYIPVSPLDVSPDPDATYAEHMGRDIQALLECDAVYFCKDWQYSKGCMLEHEPQGFMVSRCCLKDMTYNFLNANQFVHGKSKNTLQNQPGLFLA